MIEFIQITVLIWCIGAMIVGISLLIHINSNGERILKETEQELKKDIDPKYLIIACLISIITWPYFILRVMFDKYIK